MSNWLSVDEEQGQAMLSASSNEMMVLDVEVDNDDDVPATTNSAVNGKFFSFLIPLGRLTPPNGP